MNYIRNLKDYKSHINHLYDRANGIIDEFNHKLLFDDTDSQIKLCYSLNNLSKNDANYIKMFLSDILFFDYNYSAEIHMRKVYNRLMESYEYDFHIWAGPRVDID
jgi:cellobiose phosphorylase